MARSQLTNEIPKGVHSSVQCPVDEKDFTLGLRLEHAQQHAEQRGNTYSRGKQHQRALVFLGQIDKKFSTRRPDLDLGSLPGSPVQKI
jgi:hypothetical protein